MRLGVDFGTTRIVVATVDRGNYPLVGFDAPDGEVRDWFPSLIAIKDSERLFGWDAWRVQGEPSWTALRSIKRLLHHAGPKTEVGIGLGSFRIQELITEQLAALRRQLRKNSTLQLERAEPLEAMIGVPANANSNQRFLTAEAFRAAGFHVLGMLNEPSAASVESGHRERERHQGEGSRSLLVYDLGGGTFDASLVEIEQNLHTVIASEGITEIGGDDFDEILAELSLELAAIPGVDRKSLSAAQWFHLCEECRERKEALNPNTRKIVVDLERVQAGWGEVSIAVGVFYERCRPLIERTEQLVEELLSRHPERAIEALYVTGGGSELPAVARVLKESFGRRVRRSAYMRSATAIGLAIAADERANYVLRDHFARAFGVWREADRGDNVAFDVLFPRGLSLPRAGAPPLRVTRAYPPVHNIGHFRFVECTNLTADGQPAGDLSNWDDVRFPFDPALRDHTELADVAVVSNGELANHWIEEDYTCDASGMVKVTITNQSAGYLREYALGRWSGKTARVSAGSPGKRDWAQRHRESR